MQRYPAATCAGGIGSTAVGGASAREPTRADSSFAASNFSTIPRRASQLAAYRSKCVKEPLGTRLGPPDFYPQTPNCPEETLTREYLQSGYKETVEGIEEAREIQLTHVGSFVKSDLILKCKEAIRKRLRAINESRAQKRKAGQVYGVPLSGSLLSKSGIFPDQKPCSEDFRKKWIEGLAQQHKRLRSLSDNIPHGYRKKSLFENLIRHNVPMLRATWFIKVTYLNQVRPSSTGTPDKAHLARNELWTKDIIEYLQQLLDEFIVKDGAFSAISSSSDVDEPTLQFKWSYMMRLVNWQNTEGLLLPSLIIEWSFNQLLEKESTEILELFLPIVCTVLESIAMSQTYVRLFVDVVLRSINALCPDSLVTTEKSRKTSLLSSLVEMLQYFIQAVPDSFIALDCFPLPSCVASDISGRHLLNKAPDYTKFWLDNRYISFSYIASSLQKRSANLAKVVNSSLQGHGMAKVIQALDKSTIDGDLRVAYTYLFEDLSETAIEEAWIAQVSPCLRSSFKWISSINLSLICSVFFLCEWATCDFRNCRTPLSQNVKFTGGRDFCQVYIAVLLLKLKMESMFPSSQSKNEVQLVNAGNATLRDDFSSGVISKNVSVLCNSETYEPMKKKKVNLFQSPGPLHDIIVCWLDQHESDKGAGFKCLQVFIMELIRYGIFFPHVYVRQLIVSGIMDWNGIPTDIARQRRHQQILKQLPGSNLFDVLQEARVGGSYTMQEVVDVYSNERGLVLHRYRSGCSSNVKYGNCSMGSSVQTQKDLSAHIRDGASPSPLESNRHANSTFGSLPLRHSKKKSQVAELKDAISALLHFPSNHSPPIEAQADESQGSTKRPSSSVFEGAPRFEDCRGAKKQKTDDERSSSLHGSPIQFDDEEIWWVSKGSKSHEAYKAEQPLKSNKPSSRGRRKTQSLAQLAATRVESSQGASTSHVCDNKVSCPHHKSGIEADHPKYGDQTKITLVKDIGKTLKQLRMLEKRSISVWLVMSIKQLIEGNEKADFKGSHSNKPFTTADEKNAVRWRLGEDELSSILYVLDLCSDLVSSVKFLIWLLPKVPCVQSLTAHAGRNAVMMPKDKEHHLNDVGEVFLLSSIQRYENVLAAANLLPDFLNAAMHRTVAMLPANGRSYFSPTFTFARHLLKKYRDVASVAKWEKGFRGTSDQRLIAELDAVRSIDGNSGVPSSISSGVDDFDEYLRQKISSRVSRLGQSMKDIVQRRIDELVHPFYGKEIKPLAPTAKGSLEILDDGRKTAQEIVLRLVDCIRQNGGASQEVDPSVVASAVSAIVSNMGVVIAKLPDFMTGSNSQSFSSSASTLSCVRHILNVHVYSLSLLKEVLGDRFSRVFDIAFAAEASSSISGAFSPAKLYHGQFQSSPENHDGNPNQTGDILNHSSKGFVGRGTKVAAAVSALVVGAIIHGVISLEKMVTLFKLKERLDIQQFIRNARSSSNGTSRSFGSLKLDHSIEVYIHWFRILIGNCRTVFDGLVEDILGEPYTLAFSRMQRMLPLGLVCPPAYSMFAMLIWRPYILNNSIASREDFQLYQHLSAAVSDAIRHRPFRDLCLCDTRSFYEILASDMGDSEFASMLELHSPEKHLKATAFVPLRSRLFFNALIDCKMPLFTIIQEDGSLGACLNESQAYTEIETKLLDQLVHVLDTVQPAKFHWQWVELRLLLNEQALIEKIEQNMNIVESLRSLSPNSDNFALSEKERNFIEIVLTRLLVRPDAASLYSEVVSLIGKSLEESLLQNARWFLAGNDVLLGRKSIRQRLVNVANNRGLSAKAQFWKPWGWTSAVAESKHNVGDKKTTDITSIEEGEVVEEGTDAKKLAKMNSQSFDTEGSSTIQQYVTERALADLVLPLIDRTSSDSRNSFAAELIKQLSIIEQQINTLTQGGNKQHFAVSSGAEATSNKSNNRKGMRGSGSPGLGRRLAGLADSAPPSTAALRASMWLRLQFLLRLLPIIYGDREASPRNMRHMLAAVILRLLGTRVVHEDAACLSTCQRSAKKADENPPGEPIPSSPDLTGECLFDKFLWVFHALLSNHRPCWLKSKPTSKSSVKPPRDVAFLDREVLESLQSELDRMELPATIRWRLQAAMPVLPPSTSPLFCPFPVATPPGALAPLQANAFNPQGQRTSLPPPRPCTSLPSKHKAPPPSQDHDMEIDPWTLLEDGTSSVSTSSNNGSNQGGNGGGDLSNLRACSWLKGAVRVRRTDLTYIGAMDEGS